MAWVKNTIPASGTPWSVGFGGGRWFVYDDYNYDRFHVTGNWSTFTTTMSSAVSLSGGSVDGVCFDGTSWRFVSRTADGLWTSTDGATGATWVKTTPTFSSVLSPTTGQSAKHIHATPTGRLIVMSGNGVSWSDNGTTWTEVSTAVQSPYGVDNSGLAQFGNDIFAWSETASGFIHSSDNGSTWATITTPTLAGAISSVVANAAGWVICTNKSSDTPRISTNSGSSWSALSGFTADKYLATGDGSLVILSKEDFPIPVVKHSDDLSTWTTLDATGLTSDYYPAITPILVGSTTLAMVAGYGASDVGVFTTGLPVNAHRDAWLSVDTPLGSPALLGFHDFGVALDTSGGTQYYACDLVNGSTVLARMPMSSWQATIQNVNASYVQAVIPSALQYADLINANPSAEFVVYRGTRMPDGATVEQEMARAPLQTVQMSQGATRFTAVLSGYTNQFAGSTSTVSRTLQNIRTIYSGTGPTRVRCGVDWFLRPGMSAVADGVTFTVEWITYYVGGGDAYMDVGEVG